MMKYIIVAILAALLGAGIEFERGTHDIKITYMQLGVSYACGRNAGIKYAIATIKPDEALAPELPQCVDNRMLWEAMQ